MRRGSLLVLCLLAFMAAPFVMAASALAIEDRIPDDVAAQETETCLKQAPKDPAWFGSVYCPCVIQQTQNTITYTDFQAVTKELTTPDPAAGRPAFERNKGAMESIARTCMVLVEKRSLREKNLTRDSVPAN